MLVIMPTAIYVSGYRGVNDALNRARIDRFDVER